MALVSAINTNDKLLPSAPNTDFKDSMDADRYKSFLENIFEGVMNGISNITQMLKDILMAVFDKLKQWFGNIASWTKNNIFDMILDVISGIMDIGGNLWNRLSLKNSMNTVCGSFDAGMFLKHGGNNLILTGFTLMSLLTGLICMGINGAITIISGILNGIGMGLGAVVNVVGGALDMLLFNPIKSIYNGITTGDFSSQPRVATNSGINLDGLLGEITGNNELSNLFKNTPTASKMLSGYANNISLGTPIGTNKFENYADTLLPNWDVKDFTGSLNPAKEILSNSKSSIISSTNDLLGNLGSINKKDFLKIF